MKDILSDEQYKDYAVALLELGINKESNVKDPIVRALLTDKIVSMKVTDRRYERCKYNGSLGGRKKCFTKEQLREAVLEHGITTTKELAELFGCSLRTVNRSITNSEIKKMYEVKDNEK
jgi:hypothetical protein